MGAIYSIGAIFLFLSLSLSPAAFAQETKPEKDRIRIGYSVQSTTFSIPFLATEARLFRDEGIQVEVIRTPGSLAPMVLISGDVDFSIMSAFLLYRPRSGIESRSCWQAFPLALPVRL